MSSKSSIPIVFVVWCSSLGLACQKVSAQVSDASHTDSTHPQLLHPAEVVPQTSRVIGPEVMRRRAVGVDIELLKNLDPGGDNQLVFNLFQNTTFTGLVEGKTFPGARIGFPDSFSLRGSIQGITGSSFQLVYHQGVIAADIRIPGKGEYQIRPTTPGAHEVWEIDNSRFPTCALGGPFQFNPVPADKALGQSTSFSFDLGSQIDVMIVYTVDARLVTGGTINTEAESLLAVSITNASYVNSLVNTQLRLVFLDEIVYTESGNGITDLNRLTNIGDGFLDSVHAIRDTVGADNVGLFVSSMAEFCGFAWIMSNVTPAFESSSFNVTVIGCAASNLTYAHEVGHNLGCHHNRENAGGGQGAFPYSFGYRDPGLSFRTVMSYPNGSPLILQISNPDVLVGGDPTGVPEGQADSADNAKTINNTAFTVANFRLTVCPETTPVFDCNGNCIEDADDITFGSSIDCNANSIPDECDVPGGFSTDCNANNIPDECEDCNGNGLADECDLIAIYSEYSGILSPIGLGSDAIYIFVAPPLRTSDVTFDFTASAELGIPGDFIEVFLNDIKIGEVFNSTGTGCANPPDEDQIIMTQAAFDANVGSGNAVIKMTGFLDPGACGGANFVTVNMSYGSPSMFDTNDNGIIDACECDADCTGTPDGNVNVTDLLALLANWGGTPTNCDIAPPGGDGAVNVTDLLALLASWGSCFTP